MNLRISKMALVWRIGRLGLAPFSTTFVPFYRPLFGRLRWRLNGNFIQCGRNP